MSGRRAGAAILTLAVVLLGSAGIAGRSAVLDTPAIADDVFDRLQSARASAGVQPLARRADLDRAALRRAREIARLPARHRMKRDRSIDSLLSETGSRAYRGVREQVHLQSNHPVPAAGVFEGWQARPASWRAALSGGADAIGLAAVRGADRWLVFVAVLAQDPPLDGELRSAEEELFGMVNAARAERGLPALERSAALVEIARRHSTDMSRRAFFAHEDPEGRGPSDRLNSAGEDFARVTENIFRSNVTDDLMSLALESWLASPGHRRNILDEAVTETGVGIAYGDDGFTYFTQLFREVRPGLAGSRATKQ